jgi:hypothetical protein
MNGNRVLLMTLSERTSAKGTGGFFERHSSRIQLTATGCWLWAGARPEELAPCLTTP